jgi:hypothetical protein
MAGSDDHDRRVQALNKLVTEAATRIVKEGHEMGATYPEIAVAMEQALAIVVIGCAAISGTPRPRQFAQEIIELITERAHSRSMDYFNKLTSNGSGE